VGNAVIQALPIAIDAYDKLDWWTIVRYCGTRVIGQIYSTTGKKSFGNLTNRSSKSQISLFAFVSAFVYNYTIFLYTW
jgi:hypothetical protein